MRVALLTYSTKPRGSVIHSMELAEALDRRGISVCLFALNKNKDNFCRPLTCNSRLVPAQPAPEDIDRIVEQRIQEYISYLSTGQKLYRLKERVRKREWVKEKAAQEVNTIAKQATGTTTMSLNNTNRLLTMSPDSSFHGPDEG